MLGLGACPIAIGQQARPDTHAGPEIRVGIYQNPPKIFTDQHDRPAGLFVDLLQAMAAEEGWQLEYVSCTWSDCLQLLERGELDLMPDVAFSQDRQALFAFHSTPVVESWSQIYARDPELDRLAELDGGSIAVLRGSIQEDYLEQLVRGFALDVTLIRTATMRQAFAKVAARQADAAVVNHFFGDFFHRQHGLFKTPIVLLSVELYFAAPAGRHAGLLAIIDGHLREWRGEQNSPYYLALARWMDRPAERLVPSYLLWGLGGSLAILLLMAALILWMRREIRRRTRRLRESEDLLATTQRLSKVGGWNWDPEHQRMRWTDETYRIHGLSPGDHDSDTTALIDKSLACYEAESREPVRQAFQRCAEQGESYDIEVPFIDLAGRAKWVRTVGQPVRDAAGRVVRVVGNLMDVTDRRLAEERREKAEAQLRLAQKMEAVGQLAAGVAHDFNNLLSVILSYADFLLEDMATDDPARVGLEEIQSAGERAASLTRKLLAFGGRQMAAPEVLDLNQALSDLEGMLYKLLQEDIAIAIERAPDLGHVRADPCQLEQIIVNLAVNARDAMPLGGRLGFTTANVDFDEHYVEQGRSIPAGAFVMLAVSDTGSGMEPQVRDRIFEPFFTTKQRGKGTGLGLATVHGIVEQLGGHIFVYSEPGCGTNFKIYLPRAEEGLTEPSRAADEGPATGTETLLVVEDDGAVRRSVKRILERAGYTVLTARGGQDALRLVRDRDGAIQLLLTDVVMPGLSGNEVATQIQKLRPGIRILFTSGYPDDAIAHHGVLEAGKRIISKPFSARALRRMVRQVLNET